MSKRSRVFVGILLIYALGVVYLLYRLSADLDPRYRESTEESLVDSAHLLASLIEADSPDGELRAERLGAVLENLYQRRFHARIYSFDKLRVELRVYVADAGGRVLYDSSGASPGSDFSAWRDVSLTLQGRYGARTTQDIAGIPETAVMYVGAPIRQQGRIVGVVSVGKSVQSFGKFVADARTRMFFAGAIAVVAVMLLAVLVSVWLVRPFGLFTDYASRLRAEQRVSLSGVLRHAAGTIASAYHEMRDTLAGKSYVEEYVQALTHELKSPLSAIRGAAELLHEPMPEERRARFLQNIREEAARIQDLVDRLLELAALEKRRVLTDVADTPLDALLADVATSLAPLAEARRIGVTITGARGAVVRGERFLLQRALANLVQNAIDFSPAGNRIEIGVLKSRGNVEIAVRDHGAGIPDYAAERVFEKFYSLSRPDTGKRGTGLGLSFVREIAELHRGSANLRNHPDGGAVATLVLPRAEHASA